MGDAITEPIIDPDIRICDAHHHLFDFPEQTYLLADYLNDSASGHRIVSTVFVDSTAFYRATGPAKLRVIGETEFANGVAAMAANGRYGTARVCASIVGHADLTLGAAVDEVLEAHMAAGGARFRGIRHISAYDPDPAVPRSHTLPGPGLLSRADFREGFGRLAAHELVFDAWLYHPQIPDITALARAFPTQPIVLDHLGGPLRVGPYEGRIGETFAVWRDSLGELARCQNVSVKIGGFGMPFLGPEFPQPGATYEDFAAAWRPWVETCIEVFSPARCMFESNFPIDKPSVSYRTLWNAFKWVTRSLSAEERTRLFHGTAAEIYRIEDQVP